MIRPIPLILGCLTLAVAAKIGLSVASGPLLSEQIGAGQTFFVSAAQAAGAAKPEPKVEEAAAPAPQVCAETPEEMLSSIKQERGLLAEQKQKLAQRASELDLAKETLDIERTRLTELKTEIEGLLDKVKHAHTADVDRLVALYSNMKPKDAANIMNDLDIEVTVMVLGTMNERTAAPIMAALNPVRARAVSQIILERSKLPGDQRLGDIKL